MKLTILYGHRGAGKTSLLKRIQKYLPGALTFCLDEEITRQFGDIRNIFAEKGEPAFREIEKQVFLSLLEKHPSVEKSVYIAVGGGFRGEIPHYADKIFVQRGWDIRENIYVDRPSLSAKQTDFKTPSSFFADRQRYFESLNGRDLLLLEGQYSELNVEKQYFQKSFADLGGILTLLRPFTDSHTARERVDFYLQSGIDFFEVRDDLLSEKEIENLLEVLPPEKTLLSFRNLSKIPSTQKFASHVQKVDWPIEYSETHPEFLQKKLFYSLHTSQGQFLSDLKKIEKFSEEIKWAPVVDTFAQLILGHEWQQEAPDKRSFLPISQDGRWQWYRTIMKKRMPLSFFREGVGSAPDQPPLLAWALNPGVKHFAAVLGSPVNHSWSPTYHTEFFATQKMMMLAIDMQEAEWTDENLQFLQKLGLRAAAVTSPLKSRAAAWEGTSQPINTLAFDIRQKKWHGHNTDAIGFSLATQDLQLENKNIAVWGGGGILPSLQLPKAAFYSARTGELRQGVPLEDPEVVIWASGSSVDNLPPSSWKPLVVLDLSYRQDSPAILYSHRLGAKYISGTGLFFAQAQAQQKWWSDYEW